MLRDKQRGEWSSILMDQLSNFGRDDDDNRIMKILKLSYNQLPTAQLKRYFAYCSIFPQDSDIKKELLIRQWLAEGCLETSQESEHLETTGSTFFSCLLQSSLIQESRRNKFGEITHCRMHDLVHDLACLVSGHKNTAIEKNSVNDINKVRYLYLNSHHISKEQAKYVRALIFKGEVVENMFADFNFLHTLTLKSSIQELPVEIEKLINMKFLDISSTEITKLPDSINKLSNLQTLVANKLKKLPNTIIDLLDLRHLYISSIELPPFIGKLTLLQTLPYYVVGHDDGCKIGELKNLKNLKGEIKIQNLKRVKDKIEAEQADLFGKPDILKLFLNWSEERYQQNADDILQALQNGDDILQGLQLDENVFEDLQHDENVSEDLQHDESVLEGLQPHPNLKCLEIHCYKGRKFPTWTQKMRVHDAMKGHWTELTHLIDIKLYKCNECEELPNLGQLPRLKFLRIDRMSKIQSIGLSFYGLDDDSGVAESQRRTVFPALETLTLSNLENLMEWVDVERSVASFPHLKKMNLANCPKLKSAPTRFPCLQDLSIRDVDIDLKEIFVKSSIQSLDIAYYSGKTHVLFDNNQFGKDLLSTRHSLKRLILNSCENLTSLSFLPFTSLEKLRIFSCDGLVSISGLQMKSLRKLGIDSCDVLESISDSQSTLELREDKFTLEILKISNCPNLTSLSFLEYASSLRELYIKDCPMVKCVQLESCSSSLQSLILMELPGVENMDSLIPCIVRMSNLTLLILVGLPDLMNFPKGNSCLKRLRILSIGGFQKLSSLNDCLKLFLHQNISLEDLRIRGNRKLDSLPDHIQHLNAIVQLSIYRFDIEVLPEWIGKLSSLKELNISDCKRLRGLPSKEAMQRTKLSNLYINECQLLAERCIPQKDGVPADGDDSEWSKISHIPCVNIDYKEVPTRNSTVQAPVQVEKKFAGCFQIPRIKRR